MHYFVKLLAAFLLTAFLAGCGGGGGSAGTGPGGTAPTATSRVADFVLLLDKSTLTNTGAETVKLTVVTVDGSNNVVSGAAVAVASDSSTVFTPSSGSVTDAAGKFEGLVGIGADKSDRQVLVSVTVNGTTKQTSFQVVGTKITLTLTPAVIPPASTAKVSVRVTDSASVAIPNKVVTLSGSLFGSGQLQGVTDANGFAEVSFTAPAAAGSYLVKATSGGTNIQSNAQVGTSAVIPVAVIPAGVAPSLDVSPSVLPPNLPGSASVNQSQLRFLMLNSSNQPVPNVRVRFEIVSTGLGSGDSTVTTGSSTVYTDQSGVATASLTAGATVSPTNGVVVRACYQASEFTSIGQCDQSVQASLTIAAQALAVSIGNDNLLEPGTGTYKKKFVVTVADSAGRAVAGAPVDISLDITHFGKGLYTQGIVFSLNASDIFQYLPPPSSATPPVFTPPATFGARVACINEDRNRNGFVDLGDNLNGSIDSNGQATLEPRRSDIILSYADPAVKVTNASGILLIQVEYSQRFATWLSYRIKASTTVSGSQGSAERAFVTTFIDSDEPTGSFRTPPYGVGACDSSG